MVLCNLSVTRIVYNSYRHMQQLTLSLRSNENLQGCQQSINFKHKNSVVSRSSFSTSKSISLITQEEIRFINMCNMLTASFVLCWGAQMVNRARSAHLNFRSIHTTSCLCRGIVICILNEFPTSSLRIKLFSHI